MRPMTQEKRAALKKLLQASEREALGKGPVRIEPNRKDEGETGVADEDAQALSEMLQAIGSQRNRGQAEKLGRIARALRKIDEEPDEYGLCEECGEDISPKRLEAMPEALLCTECQGARDPKRGTTRKKLTDYR
jgi:RNA polymerase-binding transcription factor